MFKVGDKVICMGMHVDYSNKLIVGEEYTIAKCNNDWLFVKENESCYCYESKYFTLSHDPMTTTNIEKEIYDLKTMGYR